VSHRDGRGAPPARRDDRAHREFWITRITAIIGQDGSYLAELLLEKGYEVHAIVRRASTTNYWRIEHLLDTRAEAQGLPVITWVEQHLLSALQTPPNPSKSS
jgi:hypothetical protein